jgi:hypothetical protein
VRITTIVEDWFSHHNISLHAKVFTVSFTLTNNGTVAGHEIPQVWWVCAGGGPTLTSS